MMKICSGEMGASVTIARWVDGVLVQEILGFDDVDALVWISICCYVESAVSSEPGGSDTIKHICAGFDGPNEI